MIDELINNNNEEEVAGVDINCIIYHEGYQGLIRERSDQPISNILALQLSTVLRGADNSVSNISQQVAKRFNKSSLLIAIS